jgi:hypothetical protein
MLSSPRPGLRVRDNSFNLRLLVDTCDTLRRGLEAALIQWERDPE